MTDKLATLNEMKVLNGTDFSIYDYMFYVCSSIDLSLETVESLANLICPDFFKVDGVLLNEFLYKLGRYEDSLKYGKTKSEAQYWSNLLIINSLFPNVIEFEELCEIGIFIAARWNAVIVARCDDGARARMLCDAESGEVCISVFASDRDSELASHDD
ncbi:hypothetical protein ABDK56_09880 [Sphingomonas sp. ASV193]|uniref:hypothetical protein n=1 Tax=Sphingomonas sp. ASV193 TaxID=3144405 RepID=UPI0032E8E0EE